MFGGLITFFCFAVIRAGITTDGLEDPGFYLVVNVTISRRFGRQSLEKVLVRKGGVKRDDRDSIRG